MEVGRSGSDGALIILPGEAEAAMPEPTMQGEIRRTLRDDERSAMASLLRSSKKPHRIDRPSCLENARPKDEMLISGEHHLSFSVSTNTYGSLTHHAPRHQEQLALHPTPGGELATELAPGLRDSEAAKQRADLSSGASPIASYLESLLQGRPGSGPGFDQ